MISVVYSTNLFDYFPMSPPNDFKQTFLTPVNLKLPSFNPLAMFGPVLCSQPGRELRWALHFDTHLTSFLSGSLMEIALSVN
jgi:hypothetical protein